ncbi:MAG: CYTH domain-containing protein [Akkermansiaceae bacterium]|nr:CYTH domain-containing protein [Akkermansiaceae bacterium]
MAVEIERKYLVADDSWRAENPEGIRMAQGYLSRETGRTVRVRVAGDKAWLTIKGAAEGISRAEFEYEIPAEEGSQLLALCEPSVIDKTRFLVPHGSHVWEVDVFHGENDGLVVAEVELADESEQPELPAWVGSEVSDDRRYANSSLSRTPFSRW